VLTVPATAAIFLHTEPTDLRKGVDGLSGLVRGEFGGDPLDGSLYLFLNRRRDRVKMLFWDGTGFWIFYKKLESDCPHFFLFTEIGRPANNLACRPAAAGGMDSVSTRNGPRRRPMPRQIAVIAPPRARFPAGP
jgi:hypothetical protein